MKRVVVVVPQGDVTLELEPAPGVTVVDLGRRLATALVDPMALAARATELEAQTSEDPSTLERLLLARAAEVVRSRPMTPHRILRVASAAYRSLAGAEAPIQMALDDVEPKAGSTEESSTLTWASAEHAPYLSVMREAVDELRKARVTIVVDRDQQLPAALWLAGRLQPNQVQLSGYFAKRHWHALSQLSAFANAGLDREPCGSWRVRGLAPAELDDHRPVWREREHELVPAEPWAGRVALRALLNPDALVASECRTVVVGICQVDQDSCLGYDGTRYARDEVTTGVDTLRRSGLRIVGELWVGAPGVTPANLQSTLDNLADGDVIDWLAGFRSFRWDVSEPGGTWGNVDVTVGLPPAHYDLARSRPFTARATISPDSISSEIDALARRVLTNAALAPARVAAALVAPPEVPSGVEGGVDADCALVRLPSRLDGLPGTSAYAANLRTGMLVRLDDRIADAVAAGAAGIARLPPRLYESLVAKGVLVTDAKQSDEVLL